MKKCFSGILAIGCFSLFPLLGTSQVEAGTTYTRGSGGIWSNNSEWNPSTGHPNQEGDIAVISAGSGPRTITLDIAPQLLGLEFSGGWNLRSPDSPHTLTLQADPAAPGVLPHFYVASNTGGSNASAAVALQGGVTLSLEGGRFLLGTPYTTGRAGDGILTVESGATLNIGRQTARSQWLVAQHNHTRTGGDVVTSSMTALAGSSVSAWLTELQVGNNNYAGEDLSGSNRLEINGSVDLSAATVTAFDVSGNVVIGKGAGHRGSSGAVLLPEVDGRIGGNVLVGDSVLASGENFGSAGLLDLDGTHLEVGGDVMIDLTGRVKVTLGEGAGGLRLSEGSGLTISAFGAGAGDEDAGYFIDFTNATFSGGELLYGFAWEGDQRDDLTALVNSHAITWSAGPDGLTAGLFYDAGVDLTYIGIAPIPEPGTVSLLAGGVVLLGWLGRRRLKKAV